MSNYPPRVVANAAEMRYAVNVIVLCFRQACGIALAGSRCCNRERGYIHVKNKKYVAARALVLVAVLLLLFTWRPMTVSAAAGYPTEIEEAQRSVVRVLSLVNGAYMGTGTGFIVGTESDWYIVTNAHNLGMLPDHMVSPTPTATEVYVLNVTNNWMPATLVVHYPQGDLAVLRVNEDIPGKKILTLNPRVEREEEAYLIGYPGYAGTADWGNDIFYTGVEYQTVTHGETVGFVHWLENYYKYNPVYDSRLINAQIGHGPGNSGGPLLHADGTVMGVFFAGASDDGSVGSGCATHVFELMRLLDANDLPYYDTMTRASSGGAQSGTGGGTYSGSLSSSEILTYVLVAAIAVFGLAIILVIAAKKPKPVQQYQQYQQWPQ